MIKSQNAEINKDESEIDDAEITADQVVFLSSFTDNIPNYSNTSLTLKKILRMKMKKMMQKNK